MKSIIFFSYNSKNYSILYFIFIEL